MNWEAGETRVTLPVVGGADIFVGGGGGDEDDDEDGEDDEDDEDDG